jgi:hypothetical protein
MKPTLLYRIASGVFILIAASHTEGLLTDKGWTPELHGVRQAMNDVHFQMMGANCSYGGWYIGFGLFFTVYSLFSAFLAWHLGGLARKNPQTIGVLAWGFFAAQVANLALSWMYFFPVPVAVSALAAVCLGWAAGLVKVAKAAA